MSLVLEALRRQQAEREAAGGDAVQHAPPARSRILVWLTGIGILALLLNAGLIAWLFRANLLPGTNNPESGATSSSPAAIAAADPVRIDPAQTSDETAQHPASAPTEVDQAIRDPAAAGILPASGTISTPVVTPAVVAPEAGQTAPAAWRHATLDSLPADVSERLPGLVLSTHVYASDPRQRSVVINGIHAREGDEIAGVTLYRIDEHGITVAFAGFLVDIPVFADW